MYLGAGMGAEGRVCSRLTCLWRSEYARLLIAITSSITICGCSCGRCGTACPVSMAQLCWNLLFLILICCKLSQEPGSWDTYLGMVNFYINADT